MHADPHSRCQLAPPIEGPPPGKPHLLELDRATRARRKAVADEKAVVWNVTFDDSSVVLDNIELKDGAVVLSASSSARGERERAILADALAGLVGAPLTEIQTVEQMHASRRRAPRSWPARLGGLAQAPGEPLQPHAQSGRPDVDLRFHLALERAWDRVPSGLTSGKAVLHSFAVTGPTERFAP